MFELFQGPVIDSQRGDEKMQSSSKPVSPIVRAITTDFGRRHKKGVAGSRLLAAICYVTVGSFFLATGHWWGALLFLAAVANGVVVYLMPRWRLALDAENGTRVRSRPEPPSPRPDRIRQNSMASYLNDGPSPPNWSVPPSGPVSVSVHGWPWRSAQSRATLATLRALRPSGLTPSA